MTRILLVEDEELLRTSLTSLLHRAGFDVRAARTTAEALQAQRTFAPDVLVTDWLLQGEGDGDGIALARQLRQTTPALGVILITGLLASATRPEIEQGGLVAAVLEKPFLFADLLAAIRRISA